MALKPLLRYLQFRREYQTIAARRRYLEHLPQADPYVLKSAKLVSEAEAAALRQKFALDSSRNAPIVGVTVSAIEGGPERAGSVSAGNSDLPSTALTHWSGKVGSG